MIVFSVAEALHPHPIASGYITGRQHAEKIIELIDERAPVDDLLVVFDFEGTELATASYLKASILWLAICGRMAAGALEASELRTLDSLLVRPLPVIPVAARPNEDVRTELEEIFDGRRIPLVVVDNYTERHLGAGVVIGNLEAVPARTMRLIADMEEFTAYDLHDKYPEEAVSATAWNNRLNELYRLRLLRRRKAGKYWKYQPIAKELTYGRSILGTKS
jgi:hypothetical protein